MEESYEFYVRLGKTMKTYRIANKMKQSEMADKLGLSRTSIVNIEKGNQRILAHTYDKLMKMIKEHYREINVDFAQKVLDRRYELGFEHGYNHCKEKILKAIK